MRLTDAMLRAIMPNAPKKTREAAIPLLNYTAFNYEITTPRRMRAWLATLAVESGELRYQEEIASGAAYEGRRDLGNVHPGDGRKFKGHGRIQNTGRDVHRAYTKHLKKSGHLPFVDFEANPKRLAEEPYATDSAGWFVNGYKNLNPLADANNFLAYQIRVNGRNKKTGLPNHWTERQRYYERARRAIPDDWELTAEDVADFAPDGIDRDVLEGTEGYPDYDPVPMALKDNAETPNGHDGEIEAPVAYTEVVEAATPTPVAESASAGQQMAIGGASGHPSPQIIVKESPSVFVKIMTAFKVGAGAIITGLTAWCSSNEVAQTVAQKGAERAVEGAGRSDLETLGLVLLYAAIGIGAGVFLIWIGSKFYEKSAQRANTLNQQKISAAADERQNTVEFSQNVTPQPVSYEAVIPEAKTG